MERGMKVSDVMTSPVLTIEAESPLLQAVQIMLRRNISGLPVLDKQGQLVGMVTEGVLRPERSGSARAG
jgi:CBS domain-containing protein